MNKLLRTNSMFVIGSILFGILISFHFLSCNNRIPLDCPCPEEVCALCELTIDDINAEMEREYFMDANGFQKILDQYHQLSSISGGSAKEVRSEVDLYFDKSDSMSDKVRSAGKNDGLLSYLLNVVPRRSRYFQLTSSGFEALTASDPKIYVKIPSNYTADGNYAQLDSAMAAIIRNPERQSILVTDGELAIRKLTKNYRDMAWAKSHFSRWLKAGNQVDFIVHVVGQERLFFILFTPKKLAGKNNEQSVIRKFIKSTTNAQREGQYNWLSFNVNDYQLEKPTDDRPVQERGINSTLIDYMGTELFTRFESLSEGYEHIHFEDKEAFSQYVQDFYDDFYVDDYRPEYKERNKLFYGLKLTNEFINYQIANLDIQVEDFTGSFQDYMDYLKCGKSRTIQEEDEEGNLNTYWCNPWNDCQDNTTCNFTANQGNREAREIFELHEESTMQEDPSGFKTADIAIKPSKNFQEHAWWDMGYIKVGIFIKDVTYSNQQDFDLLKWNQGGELNTGLSESIRLAMQDLEPKNKLIYTYYFTYPIQEIGLN